MKRLDRTFYRALSLTHAHPHTRTPTHTHTHNDLSLQSKISRVLATLSFCTLKILQDKIIARKIKLTQPFKIKQLSNVEMKIINLDYIHEKKKIQHIQFGQRFHSVQILFCLLTSHLNM